VKPPRILHEYSLMLLCLPACFCCAQLGLPPWSARAPCPCCAASSLWPPCAPGWNSPLHPCACTPRSPDKPRPPARARAALHSSYCCCKQPPALGAGCSAGCASSCLPGARPRPKILTTPAVNQQRDKAQKTTQGDTKSSRKTKIQKT